MGLLVGCATLPMALALMAVFVVVIAQEPLTLVYMALMLWMLRAFWRAHRAALRRRDQRL